MRGEKRAVSGVEAVRRRPTAVRAAFQKSQPHVVLGTSIQTPRAAVLDPRLVGAAEGRASSAALRPYICWPHGVGLVGGHGASCLVSSAHVMSAFSLPMVVFMLLQPVALHERSADPHAPAFLI